MDRRSMTLSEEEIEALLRRQPRRMPSPALWTRLGEEAPRRVHRAWAAWAGAAAVAVVGVMLVIAMSRTAPPTLAPPQSTVRPRHAASPHDSGRASIRGAGFQPASAPKGPRAPAALAALGRGQVGNLPHGTARALARHDDSIAPRKAIILSPPAPVPPAPTPPGQPETTPLVPPTTVAAANDTHSTYYLEVSRGGTGSALSGSVTRDASGSVTQIEMAYDTVHRDAPVQN